MRTWIKLLCGWFAAFSAISCQSSVDLTRTTLPAGQQPQGAVDSANLAYDLNQKTWCSNDEAFSMVLMLVTGEDHCKDFNERFIELGVKGLIDTSWKLQADEPVTKGVLAYMLCRKLDLDIGVMMRLLPTRRYAYREAVYHGLMTLGSADEPLTGPEVVGIMSRAARWQD